MVLGCGATALCMTKGRAPFGSSRYWKFKPPVPGASHLLPGVLFVFGVWLTYEALKCRARQYLTRVCMRVCDTAPAHIPLVGCKEPAPFAPPSWILGKPGRCERGDSQRSSRSGFDSAPLRGVSTRVWIWTRKRAESVFLRGSRSARLLKPVGSSPAWAGTPCPQGCDF